MREAKETKKIYNVFVSDKATKQDKNDNDYLEFTISAEEFGNYPKIFRIFSKSAAFEEFKKVKKGDAIKELEFEESTYNYQGKSVTSRNLIGYLLDKNKAPIQVHTEINLAEKSIDREVYIIRQNALTQANNFIANIVLRQEEMKKMDKVPAEELKIYDINDLKRYAENVEAWVLRKEPKKVPDEEPEELYDDVKNLM